VIGSKVHAGKMKLTTSLTRMIPEDDDHFNDDDPDGDDDDNDDDDDDDLDDDDPIDVCEDDDLQQRARCR